jgi:hypothetical protein
MSEYNISQQIAYQGFNFNSSKSDVMNVEEGAKIRWTMDAEAGTTAHSTKIDNEYAVFTTSNCSVSPSSQVAMLGCTTAGTNHTVITLTGSEGQSWSVTAVYTHEKNGSTDEVTKTFTVSGTISNDIYGMEIRDGSGNLRMSVGRRQPRLHAFVTGTGANNSNQTITVSGFNTPSPAEWHAVNIKDGSLYRVTQGTTANQLTLTHIEEDVNNFFTLTGTDDYELVIMRY